MLARALTVAAERTPGAEAIADGGRRAMRVGLARDQRGR